MTIPDETMQHEERFFSRTTYKPRFFEKVILIALAIIALVSISVFLSYYTVGTDFAVFYQVGNIINSSKGHNELVYNHTDFVYSVAVAYLFGFFALLPYHVAKAVFILINCVMYLAAIAMILRFNKASGRWFAYPLAFSCLWLPFIQDIRLANLDCILLFLVTLSALSAEKKQPTLSGFLLGIASVFKLFPIAIGMVMGLKNWRIFAVCILTIGASLFTPGSLKWISGLSFATNWEPGFTLPYLLLSHINIVYFIFYVSVIAGMTAWMCYRSRREANYLLLVAFAIPAVFLTMNMLEYQHLTLLAFSFVYLLTSSHKSNRLLLAGIILSFLMISSFFFLGIVNNHFIIDSVYQSKTALISFGLFVLWFALVILKWPFLLRNPSFTR